jgi:hypothetical protein
VIEEIIRRATNLGYDIEVVVHHRRLRTQTYVSIFTHSATAQPGYEYVRVFQGGPSMTIKWIEEKEEAWREAHKEAHASA